MFGQNNQPNDQIPEESIQGALGDDNGQPNWGHPGVPLDSNDNNPQVVQPSTPSTTAHDDDQNQTVPAAVPSPVSAADANTDELIDIKQKALTQLSPLVGHLDQSPEEKFRTTMMMIQASDNQALIPQAYEAANAITDEKARAQALLDIVNEINYFTQHHQG